MSILSERTRCGDQLLAELGVRKCAWFTQTHGLAEGLYVQNSAGEMACSGGVSTQAANGALGAYGAMGLSTVWPAVGPGQAVGGPAVWACRVAGRVPGAWTLRS